MPYDYDRRIASKGLNLSHWGLEGLTKGESVTLYHGSTRLFKTFDLSKSRAELVDKYYGAGIFLVPSKRVAEDYANANRNIGFDPSIIDDLKRRNHAAGAFMDSLYRLGNDAWDQLTPEKLGVAPEAFSKAAEKFVGNVDPNTLADVTAYIIGSKKEPFRDDGPINIFNMSTGMPDWVYKNLDEIGLDSFVYRPKVYTVSVKVSNPLVTASKSQAKSARSKGYDSVVYYGSGIVSDVPEVAVFNPSDVRVMHVEEA
jgi:hypothetical protein